MRRHRTRTRRERDAIFRTGREREDLERLRESGLDMTAPKRVRASQGPFQGKTLVLRVRCANLTREEATELIVAAGGKVTGSRQQENGLRRRGHEGARKLARAEELGVPVLDEDGLRELLEREG